MRRLLITLLALTLALALAVPMAMPAVAAPTNLVANGSFETPVSGWWGLWPTGYPGLAWTVEWREPHPELTPVIELQRGPNGWLSYDGFQHCELASHPYATRISQNITTVANGWYMLSFAFSPRPEAGNGTNAQAKMRVRWGGAVVADLQRAWSGSGSQPEWTKHSYLVKASTASTALMFIDTGTADDSVGPFLDDVSVIGPFKEFLTGGGKATNNITGAVYTFAGTVGYMENGDIVGQFQIVDHANKVSYHCSNEEFISLYFRPGVGSDSGMPPATYPVAVFTGNFTSDKNSTVTLMLVIADYGEPGKGTDKISIFVPPAGPGATYWLGGWQGGDLPVWGVLLDGGNFQVHEGYKTP